jgi:hypothetical protein
MLMSNANRRTGAPRIPSHRIYHLVDIDDISAPPQIIECANEQDAITKAACVAIRRAVELWDGERLVARFPGDKW